jgi:hypothetical protein
VTDVNRTSPNPVDFLADSAMTGMPQLGAHHLPVSLHAFVTDTASRMGVDPVSVALAAIVTCASVIHESWRIQPKRHDTTWTEAARLWGAIVGDPSILKTPVISVCTRPVERLDALARSRHAVATREYQQALGSWKAAGGNALDEPRSPRLERYLVEGTTVEALTEVLRDDADAKQCAPQSRVLIRQDEMSEWIAGFDRYRGGGRGGSDRGAYLRLYNGGRHVMDRIGRGSFAIPNWSACILGGIQPEPIRKIAQEAADDGLLQRFLFCVPERQCIGEDRRPDTDAIARYEALVIALAAPGPAADAHSPRDERSVVVLSAEAHRHRTEIDDLARGVAALPDASSRLKASLGKWPGIFARLALCFHLIEAADDNANDQTQTPQGVLSESTARCAAALMRDVLLPHLLRAESVMFSSTQSEHARWIAGWILAKQAQRIAVRDVVQAYRPLRAPENRRALFEVMESMVMMEWLRPEEQINTSRPPSAWMVNPLVHSIFATQAALERDARAAVRRQIGETLRRHASGTTVVANVADPQFQPESGRGHQR